MNIITLAGAAGIGKDTAADYLVREHGVVKVANADPMKRIARDVYDFSVEQLWGPSSMRNAPDKRYPRRRYDKHVWSVQKGADGAYLCANCGLSTQTDSLEGECVLYLTPRLALQLLGSQWGRHCYRDTWVDITIRTAKAVLEDGMAYDGPRGLYEPAPGTPEALGVVVPDGRFTNEFAAVRAVGGEVWRIRGTAPPPSAEGWREHDSETEQAALPDEFFDAVIVNRKLAFEDLYADVRLRYERFRAYAGYLVLEGQRA
jgi:hypothetical protein